VATSRTPGLRRRRSAGIAHGGQYDGMNLWDRLNSLDDRTLGSRPMTEPPALHHRRLWGLVLTLLIAGIVTALLGVPYLPGLLVAIGIGTAVAAVITARRAHSK
jgi:hypothetical protein